MTPPDLPRSFQAALDAPPVPPKGWQQGVGPAFVALVLSVVFLDRLAPATLLVGGLAPSVAGAVLGSVLAYWCLYYAPAMWGATTRKPLAVVAASTFGARGAAWLPGVWLGLVQVAWFAITIDYATLYAMSGLSALGMVDPRHLATFGPVGSMARTPSPVFLGVAAVWSLTSAIIGTLAIRLVAAVMSAYLIFPALALGATLLWAMPTVPLGPVAAVSWGQGGGRAMLMMAGLVFAFLGSHALLAADWGAASRTPRDARVGGLVGVMLAPPILATIALLIVAGFLGRTRPSEEPPTASASEPGGAIVREVRGDALRDVYLRGIGGTLGGTGLLVLSLGLLGPACTTPFVIARQFSALWPRPPRWIWSVLGAGAAWPLIASGFTRTMPWGFFVLGSVTAPALGAMTADLALSRGAWRGPRRGWNPAGLIAWLAGVLVVPISLNYGRGTAWGDWVPPIATGYAAAFLAFVLADRIGARSARLAIPEVKGPMVDG